MAIQNNIYCIPFQYTIPSSILYYRCVTQMDTQMKLILRVSEWCGKNINKQDSAIEMLVLPLSPKTLGRKKSQNKQHIFVFLPHQQTKRSSRIEAAACGHAVFSDDTSLRCYHLSTSLPTFFSGLLAQHIACQIC